jgi:transposase-like protein
MNPIWIPLRTGVKMRACKQKEARMRTTSQASRREFWRQVVARQRVSGLSICRFCAKEGLATATFYIWRRRLGQGAGGRDGTPAPVGFAPVRVQPEAVPAAAPGGIEIVLPHDRRVRLTGTVDRRQLADVLAALGEVGGSRSC